MNEIFISYASKDRERGRMIAAALGGHGWDVWWDREIPLGKAFDEIIEKPSLKRSV
jgi:TIR domain